MDWQPIETAPRDGTVIDLWEVEKNFGASRATDCRWCKFPIRGGVREGWGYGLADDPDFLSGEVTHWMPLPEPPTLDKTS